MRPRTIFGAILIWFIVTVLLCLLGSVATSFLLSARWSRPDSFLRRIQQFELSEAILAFEEGGREKLAAYLGRLDGILRARHRLIDSKDRSLVDGSDCSLSPSAGGPRAWFILGTPPPMVVRSPHSSYRMIIDAPPPPFGPFDLLLTFLWLPILIAALCYLLAIHLASPLRKLTLAIESFGGGDLSARARVEVMRRDEIGDLARAFDAMAERIQTLMTAERRLLQDVSHELRSPLARLAFGVELARTSPNRGQALDRVKKDLARLNLLVDQLLQLTRSEGDPNERDLSSIDLNLLLRDLVIDCSLEAQAKGCRLEFQDSESESITVRGEPELLRRAIENVLRNAILHTEENTIVDVALARERETITIQVRDRGPGVPEADLQRIFQPFYRVEGHRDRHSGGVGLGLAIASRAVLLHGGRIFARNIGPGLCIQIDLPATSTEVSL